MVLLKIIAQLTLFCNLIIVLTDMTGTLYKCLGFELRTFSRAASAQQKSILNSRSHGKSGRKEKIVKRIDREYLKKLFIIFEPTP